MVIERAGYREEKCAQGPTCVGISALRQATCRRVVSSSLAASARASPRVYFQDRGDRSLGELRQSTFMRYYIRQSMFSTRKAASLAKAIIVSMHRVIIAPSSKPFVSSTPHL